MIDLIEVIHKIPVVGQVLHLAGTVACNVAQAAGSVTKESLHTVGDSAYNVLQGFKTFVDALFGCGGVPPTP